ncbi:putative caffeine synthase 2 [Hordeum vulgare]|nr:putative caffeine synthase 2 [Hordeum vulgare]
MKGLKLSDLERKGTKIELSGGGKRGVGEPKALAKLLLDKLALEEGMANALGKMKALDDAPWMFGKSLLVVEDFDRSKSVKDYEFSTIPVEKECSIRLDKGEEKQFGPGLKAYIPRSNSDKIRDGWNEGHHSFSDRSYGSGRNFRWGNSKDRLGSDSDSWKRANQIGVTSW